MTSWQMGFQELFQPEKSPLFNDRTCEGVGGVVVAGMVAI